MFLNYLQIQFIRFFKGRNFLITMFISFIIVFLMSFMVISFVGIINIAGTTETVARSTFAKMAEEGMLAQRSTIGISVTILPTVAGILTCLYISNYYSNRIYVNLEISMRNSILYCLSEVVILLIMALVMYGSFIAAVGVVGITGLDGANILTNDSDTAIALGVSGLVASMSASIMAFFCSKLCQSKFKSIILFIALESIGTVLYSLVALTKISIIKYAAFLLSDYALLVFIDGNEVSTVLVCVIAASRILALFILSVIMFNKRKKGMRL